MDKELYNLHLEAGRKCGHGKTCGLKKKYETEADAIAASRCHNAWPRKRHEVEPYPCAFCGKWHIGGVMSIYRLKEITAWEDNTA